MGVIHYFKIGGSNYTSITSTISYISSLIPIIIGLKSLKGFGLKNYGGKPLVRGGKFQTLEGEDYPRTVIWEFPSYEQAIKCHDSKEYQAGWALAKDTTERNLQIIEGVNIE